MDYKEMKELRQRMLEVELMYFGDFEVIVIGSGLCFRVEDFDGDAVEGYYDTENNNLSVYYEPDVDMGEGVLENIERAITSVIEKFLGSLYPEYPEHYRKADKEAFGDLKQVMIQHELWGDQYVLYVMDLLIQRYGLSKATRIFEDEINSRNKI